MCEDFSLDKNWNENLIGSCWWTDCVFSELRWMVLHNIEQLSRHILIKLPDCKHKWSVLVFCFMPDIWRSFSCNVITKRTSPSTMSKSVFKRWHFFFCSFQWHWLPTQTNELPTAIQSPFLIHQELNFFFWNLHCVNIEIFISWQCK